MRSFLVVTVWSVVAAMVAGAGSVEIPGAVEVAATVGDARLVREFGAMSPQLVIDGLVEEDTTLLHLAVLAGQEGVVAELLSSNCPATPLAGGKPCGLGSPLHVAAARGEAEIAQMLLKHGASVNARAIPSGLTPLHLAAACGSLPMVRDLVDGGAEINARTSSEGLTPLASACAHGHLGVVSFLLERKADVSSGGRASPLHLAAANGYIDIVKVLLKAGADPDVRCSDGTTAVRWALDAPGTRGCFPIDYHGGVPRDPRDQTVSMAVASIAGYLQLLTNRAERLSVQWPSPAKPDTTPDRGATVKCLIDARADLRDGSALLAGAAACDLPEIVELLIAAGVPPSGRCAGGITPLHLARSAEVAKALLKRKADISARTDNGETPLAFVLWSGDGRLEVVQALVGAGADPNAVTATGQTVLHLAGERGCPQAVPVLLAAGAQPNARDGHGRTPLLSMLLAGEWQAAEQLLRDARPDVTAASDDGTTALCVAARNGQVALVRDMLARGASASTRTTDGKSPLHAVGDYLARTMSEAKAAPTADGIAGPGEVAESVVSALLGAGADPAARDSKGSTPLHSVAATGAVGLLALRRLIAAGAPLDARDAGGLSPIGTATSYVIVRTLVDAGADVSVVDIKGRTLIQRGIEEPSAGLASAVGAAVRQGQPNAAHKGVSLAFAAARARSVELLDVLLAAGADTSLRDAAGATLLHAAVGSPACVRSLLAHGVDPNAKDGRNAPPLWYCGTSDSALDAASALIKAHADPNVMVGGVPLIIARSGSLAWVRLLIEHGVDALVKTRLGVTVLDDSSAEGVAYVGARPGGDAFVAGNGAYPVARALRGGDYGKAKALLAFPIRLTGQSVLGPALDQGLALLVPDLLAHGADANERYQGEPVLAHACRQGSLPVVKALLDGGADPNAAGDRWKAGVAASAVQSGDPAIVRLLVAGGLKLDVKGPAGVSLLRIACMTDDVPMIEMLLDMGAQADMVDAQGNTALHTAASCNASGAIARLVAKGARVEAANRDGLTPLHVAARTGSIAAARALIAAGADAATRTKLGGKTAVELLPAGAEEWRPMLEKLGEKR